MLQAIKESDWKIFRQLRSIALERFCQRVLNEIVSAAADAGKSGHERYLDVFRLIKRRDKELAHAFDDLRRSTALAQIAIIQSHGLFTEEEFSRFSPETRNVVESIVAAMRGR